MDKNLNQRIIDALKLNVRYSISSAKKSVGLISEYPDKLHRAVAYLQLSISQMSVAKSIYWSQIDILERDEAEELFRLFDVFAEEMVDNYATNHSQQWSLITFDQMMDFFNDSVFAFQG